MGFFSAGSGLVKRMIEQGMLKAVVCGQCLRNRGIPQVPAEAQSLRLRQYCGASRLAARVTASLSEIKHNFRLSSVCYHKLYSKNVVYETSCRNKQQPHM